MERIIYENKELSGRYMTKTITTKQAQLCYQALGWILSKIYEDEEGEQKIIIVKKK